MRSALLVCCLLVVVRCVLMDGYLMLAACVGSLCFVVGVSFLYVGRCCLLLVVCCLSFDVVCCSFVNGVCCL